ncbi:MAG: hypothetical protein PHQ80_01895 [Candidatus ainarchaeum sp.]|nr:hypothetical protein [Candidatus ainarchaeum sp.]MDD5096143.1 hypothetical protein [Candidatus ainarchaeum sp.]
MDFDAYSAIIQKYAPILGSDELAFKLAIRFQMFHCEGNRTPEKLEVEFRSMLVDLGWERKLALLAEMFGRAEGEERGFVKDALLEGLGKCGTNGYAREPSEIMGMEGMPPDIITAAEEAVIAAAQVRAKHGGNLLGDAAALLGKASTPWRVADKICEACAGTIHFTDIADLFARGGMPIDSHIIAMDALSNSIDRIEKAVRAEIRQIECAGPGEEGAEGLKKKATEPMEAVVCLLQKKKLPSGLYVRVIRMCRSYGLHGGELVEALDGLVANPDMDPRVKDEAEKALMGGGEARRRLTPVAPVVAHNGFVDSGFRTPSGRIIGKVTPAEAAPTIPAKLAKK